MALTTSFTPALEIETTEFKGLNTFLSLDFEPTTTSLLAMNDTDPCSIFQCSAELVPATVGLCKVFEKGPFDFNCFIPCQLNNCTISYVSRHLCTEYFCEPIPSPSPPDPFTTTTTPGPSPVTDPSPSFALPTVVGISCAGKCFKTI